MSFRIREDRRTSMRVHRHGERYVGGEFDFESAKKNKDMKAPRIAEHAGSSTSIY